mmetsp:Transcript_11634/g.34486  ORF Transcript_11634/g.34486 Transcript_11634/m.34486 type:complete len:282 (-) Transcript_11634:635-1480(-)
MRASGGSRRRLTSQSMLWRGSHFSMCATAAATPSSPRIPSARALALACVSGAARVRNLSARSCAVSLPTGHGGGPTPARRTMSPQKCWSPKNGQTRVGLPARRPAAVVPAPPWWTTAATLGRSQSWGAGPMSKHLPPLGARVSSLLQLDCTRTRRPVRCDASTIMADKRLVSGITMDPKPTKMGGGPARSHATRSAKGASSKALPADPDAGGWITPTTSASAGQSKGFGTKLGLHMKEKGTWKRGRRLPPKARMGGRRRWRQRQMLSMELLPSHMASSTTP